MLNNDPFFKDQQQPLNADNFLDGQQQLSTNDDDQIRKPYCKPQLEEFGDLRALTFGSFPGVLDSGGLSSFTPP